MFSQAAVSWLLVALYGIERFSGVLPQAGMHVMGGAMWAERKQAWWLEETHG